MIRVFLAEDDTAVRQMIRSGIDWEGEGLELVGEAADGGLALAMIFDQHADILIASRRMPFMDGEDLFSAVRANMPWAQCILLTGYDGREGAFGIEAPRNREMLLKPVNLRELTEALRRAARRVEERLRMLGEALRCPDVHAAREDVDLRRWMSTGEDWSGGLKCRLLRVLPGDGVSGDWQARIFNLLKRGIAFKQRSRTVCLPDGSSGLIVSGRDSAALEEDAYGSASAIYKTMLRATGECYHIHISPAAWDGPSMEAAW